MGGKNKIEREPLILYDENINIMNSPYCNLKAIFCYLTLNTTSPVFTILVFQHG